MKSSQVFGLIIGALFAFAERGFTQEKPSSFREFPSGDLVARLKGIEATSLSPEELGARKEALLRPKHAERSASLQFASAAHFVPLVTKLRAEESPLLAMAKLRDQSTNAEELVQKIEIWRTQNQPPRQAEGFILPKPAPSDEVQRALFDIRFMAKSPQKVVALTEELFRLNPFLTQPTPR